MEKEELIERVELLESIVKAKNEIIEAQNRNIESQEEFIDFLIENYTNEDTVLEVYE